jgi:hypothetical protein
VLDGAGPGLVQQGAASAALDGIEPPVRCSNERQAALDGIDDSVREGYAVKNRSTPKPRSSIESPHDLGHGGEEKLSSRQTESTQSGQTILMRVRMVRSSILLGSRLSSSGLPEGGWHKAACSLQPRAISLAEENDFVVVRHDQHSTGQNPMSVTG